MPSPPYTASEFVTVVEVKHNLHESDVEKMREVLVTNFRFLFRELSDKILVPTVAGITANLYAVTLAHECGLRVAFAGRAESLGGCAVFALRSA